MDKKKKVKRFLFVIMDHYCILHEEVTCVAIKWGTMKLQWVYWTDGYSTAPGIFLVMFL